MTIRALGEIEMTSNFFTKKLVASFVLNLYGVLVCPQKKILIFICLIVCLAIIIGVVVGLVVRNLSFFKCGMLLSSCRFYHV